jgi:hypothetical protein
MKIGDSGWNYSGSSVKAKSSVNLFLMPVLIPCMAGMMMTGCPAEARGGGFFAILHPGALAPLPGFDPTATHRSERVVFQADQQSGSLPAVVTAISQDVQANDSSSDDGGLTFGLTLLAVLATIAGLARRFWSTIFRVSKAAAAGGKAVAREAPREPLTLTPEAHASFDEAVARRLAELGQPGDEDGGLSCETAPASRAPVVRPFGRKTG